jgi:hypothetical protein
VARSGRADHHVAVLEQVDLVGSAPIPRAEVLRFGNDVGFGMVSLAGVLANLSL